MTGLSVCGGLLMLEAVASSLALSSNTADCQHLTTAAGVTVLCTVLSATRFANRLCDRLTGAPHDEELNAAPQEIA